jgi:hypothetical protein
VFSQRRHRTGDGSSRGYDTLACKVGRKSGKSSAGAAVQWVTRARRHVGRPTAYVRWFRLVLALAITSSMLGAGVVWLRARQRRIALAEAHAAMAEKRFHVVARPFRPGRAINFYGEGTTLYQNIGQGLVADRSTSSGIGLASRFVLGFGIALADEGNDGRPDVIVANGHVNDNWPFHRYAMPAQLYEKLGHFVTIQLEGTRSNRDGVGARGAVASGGRRQVAQRTGGGSYLSANDPRLHFGLGSSARIESMEVRWPSGTIDRHADLPADTGYRLVEGDPKAHPLAGFRGRGKGPGADAPG